MTLPCPQCGAGMVERRGKHGPSLGCQRYPRCKSWRPLAQHGGGLTALPPTDPPEEAKSWGKLVFALVVAPVAVAVLTGLGMALVGRPDKPAAPPSPAAPPPVVVVTQPPASAPAPQPQPPSPAPGKPATDRQRNYVRTLARDKAVTDAQLASLVRKATGRDAKVDDLTAAEASKLIDELKSR